MMVLADTVDDSVLKTGGFKPHEPPWLTGEDISCEGLELSVQHDIGRGHTVDRIILAGKDTPQFEIEGANPSSAHVAAHTVVAPAMAALLLKSSALSGGNLGVRQLEANSRQEP